METVRKTFKLEDQIILDDGTVLVVTKRSSLKVEGVKSKSGYHLIIQRDGDIGKITVVKPQDNQEVVNGNR